MKTGHRYLYRSEEQVASTLSQQAAAEARWLASANARPQRPTAHELRDVRIRELAYLRAQQRGFAPGHEVEDWLAAEEEVDGAFH